MTSRRERDLERVCQAALERPVGERAGFLVEACGGDDGLRQEVEALLAHEGTAAAFLETPAIAVAAQTMRTDSPALAAGQQIGSYTIVSRLGSGGMGEVYRARDAMLGREVAIKVLPTIFTSDPERLGRFEREARVLASLNHPNIATIYGIERIDGIHALILEVVEGETLGERLHSVASGFAGRRSRGGEDFRRTQVGLALSDALTIARQIAEALEAAHEKGIVHRDLKPANIKIRPDGVVKVLDFGLAKAVANDASVADVSQLSKQTVGGTRDGMILGTAAYMSPEQARGRPVDRRTDIWAFGCVLYEILTGTPAFSGSDLSEVLAGIIKSEPNWDALPGDLPPVLGVCLRRCLHKDSGQRWRDIGDLRLVLDGSFETPRLVGGTSDVGVPPRAIIWRRPQLVVAAGVMLVAVTGFTVWSLMRPDPPAPRPMGRFPIQLPARGQDRNTGTQQVVISSERILYIARQGEASQFYSRLLDQLDWIPIKGAEGAFGSLFMSPDGGRVGFFDTSDATIKTLTFDGDPPTTICKSCGTGVFRGASWGANGSIVFATTNVPGLMQVSASNGVPAPLTSPQREGEVHLQPHFLPDGKALLFTVRRPGEPDRIEVLSLDTLARRPLVEGSSPRFATSGHLVFLRGAALWAAPFDSNRLQLLGDVMRMREDVAVTARSAWFDLSREGTLVYSPPAGVQPERMLVWVDRSSRLETPTPAPARQYTWPRLSHDGTRVAVAADDQNRDIWIWDVGRPGLKRFTFDRALDQSPVWTHDDLSLVFVSDRQWPSNLFLQALDRPGSARRLTNTSNVTEPYSVSPDGTLVFGDQMQRFDLWSLILNGKPNPQCFVQTSSGERDAEFSPDGRFVAYSSDESTRTQFEIYVRPFAHSCNNDKPIQITTSGGRGAVWAESPRRGLELFYQAPDGWVMAVSVKADAGFTFGTPYKVFDGTRYVRTTFGRMYDVSPDGERFLMLKPSGGPEQAVGPASLVVVLNWIEELRQRVPTR